MFHNGYKFLVGFIGVILILLLAFLSIKKPLWDTNAKALIEKVNETGNMGIDEVKLQEITPFDWDIVYSFGPYVSEEDIYATVGYKWDRNIITGVSEGMNQIVFMNEGKVVCHIEGYPTSSGVYIGFGELDAQKGISFDMELPFHIEKNENYIFLKYMGDALTFHRGGKDNTIFSGKSQCRFIIENND